MFLKCIINYSTDIELKLNACNLFIDFSNNACTLQYSRGGSIYSYFIDESKIPALKQYASFYKTKTVELKREIENQRKAKIEKYWQENSEEKKALDEEKERLTKELNEIKPIIAKTQAEIENVESGKKKMPADFVIESLETEMKNLTLERNKLGIFKGKQKAEIDKKIVDLLNQKSQAKNTLISQRKELISELRKEHLPMCQRSLDIKSRLSEIERELTKDR